MKSALFAFLILATSFTCEALDQPFTVVRVDPASENLQAFWGDERGKPFRQFGPLSNWLRGKGKN